MQFNTDNSVKNVNLDKVLKKANKEPETGFTVRVPERLKLEFEFKVKEENAIALRKGRNINRITIKSVVKELFQGYVDGEIKLKNST